MQDGASAHLASSTLDDLRVRGVMIMEWPLFSLDLNPIEMI